MAPTKHCVVWGLLGLLAASQVASSEQINHTLDDVNQSSFEFAFDLYSALTKTRVSNIFFSPLSIHITLGLVYVGAGGKTALELATGLHLPHNVSLVELRFKQLLKSLHKDDKNVTLEMANKIYINKGFRVKDDFNKTATDNFLAEVQDVKFSSSETVRNINGWIAKKTHDKITNFVQDGSLTADTKLLLVNAVYFKGMWANAFEKNKTTTQPFHLNSEKSKMVEMMYVKSSCHLASRSDIEASVLELNYKGDDVSLVIILPFQVDGLSKVESKLNVDKLRDIISYNNNESDFSVRRDVEVYLPKFKLEESTPLNDVLKSLGMVNMFDGSADFSGISDSSMNVDQVLHKAVLEVNEEGTVAAAVTVVKFIKFSFDDVPIVPKFVADRPFMFILQSKSSNSVLFMGRLNDPL